MVSSRRWIFVWLALFVVTLHSGAGEEEVNVAKPPRKLSNDFFAHEIARIESDLRMSEWADVKRTWKNLATGAKIPKLRSPPSADQTPPADRRQDAQKASGDVERARKRYAQLHSKWVSMRSELEHVIHDHVAAIEARYHQHQLMLEYNQMIEHLRKNLTTVISYLTILKQQINRAKRESGQPTSSLPAQDLPQGVPPATDQPLSELMKMRRIKEEEVRKLKRRLLYWTNHFRAVAQAVPELEERVRSYAKRKKSLSDAFAQLGQALKTAGERLQHALRVYLSFLTNDVEVLSQHPGSRHRTTVKLAHKLHDSERKEKDIAHKIEKLEQKLKLAKRSTKKYKDQMKQRKVWQKPLQITLKTVKQAEAELAQVSKTLKEINKPVGRSLSHSIPSHSHAEESPSAQPSSSKLTAHYSRRSHQPAQLKQSHTHSKSALALDLKQDDPE